MRISDLQIAIIHDRDIYGDSRQIIRERRFSDAPSWLQIEMLKGSIIYVLNGCLQAFAIVNVFIYSILYSIADL